MAFMHYVAKLVWHVDFPLHYRDTALYGDLHLYQRRIELMGPDFRPMLTYEIKCGLGIIPREVASCHTPEVGLRNMAVCSMNA